MFDFLQFLYELRHKPLGFIVLAVCVFIIDRLGRKFITSQVKRLFHIDEKSDFYHYVQNQRRIESKLDAIMQKEGITTWNAPISDARQQASATRSAPFSSWHSITLSLAQHAKKYIQLRRDHMTKINKAILLPLLSAIALFVKQAFGYEVSDEYINMAADIALYLIMFIGLFIKPRKEVTAPQQIEEVEGYYH